MPTSIVVIAAGRDITVQPTRVAFPSNSGTRTLRWLPAGNAVDIMSIEFDSPNAPIQGLAKLPSGEWTATWNTAQGGEALWKYSVTVAVAGQELPVLDPEVENGPPIGVEEDEEPGGGG
jgi:hypothetical protein